MSYITEPAKNIPVCYEADICVAGGGCTGVFAAVRAARLGAKVVLIEQSNSLGGAAASGLVNVWHTLHDINDKNQIIAGLTWETIERLKAADSLANGGPYSSYTFNSEDLKIELDNLIKESAIKVYLHTFYSSVICEDGKISAVIIENKNGRSAVKAKFFIDATGDGDIARDLNIERYINSALQPPTACFLLQGDMRGINADSILAKHGHEENIEDDWGWHTIVPNCENISMRADSHVFGVNCAEADELTFAEIEGRRKMRGLVRLLRKYGNPDTKYNIVNSCSYIGIRETYHYKTLYKASEEDLLHGKKYDDAVLNGTYRVDIHHDSEAGITFRYLDGKESVIYGRYRKSVEGRWREETKENPEYYQVPFRILINEKIRNFIPVGRMINADSGSFGALRVMVNLNQLGEAAGTGAYLAVAEDKSIQDIDGKDVRRELKKGGSIIL
jgi:hypothetical protein